MVKHGKTLPIFQLMMCHLLAVLSFEWFWMDWMILVSWKAKDFIELIILHHITIYILAYQIKSYYHTYIYIYIIKQTTMVDVVKVLYHHINWMSSIMTSLWGPWHDGNGHEWPQGWWSRIIQPDKMELIVHHQTIHHGFRWLRYMLICLNHHKQPFSTIYIYIYFLSKTYVKLCWPHAIFLADLFGHSW